ncbi:hypothetical protein NDU88_003240 [Pleurodeles waltl]|uniref:Uncharacterized protein n=1 Tax=Pleurodeles waltl TaxID=8319 RepID=A0AAV7QBK9_PLEWA|nr:hypothetical protein NDU88_003240 [Pleurodeles waltl]
MFLGLRQCRGPAPPSLSRRPSADQFHSSAASPAHGPTGVSRAPHSLSTAPEALEPPAPPISPPGPVCPSPLLLTQMGFRVPSTRVPLTHRSCWGLERSRGIPVQLESVSTRRRRSTPRSLFLFLGRQLRRVWSPFCFCPAAGGALLLLCLPKRNLLVSGFPRCWPLIRVGACGQLSPWGALLGVSDGRVPFATPELLVKLAASTAAGHAPHSSVVVIA